MHLQFIYVALYVVHNVDVETPTKELGLSDMITTTSDMDELEK